MEDIDKIINLWSSPEKINRDLAELLRAGLTLDNQARFKEEVINRIIEGTYPIKATTIPSAHLIKTTLILGNIELIFCMHSYYFLQDYPFPSISYSNSIAITRTTELEGELILFHKDLQEDMCFSVMDIALLKKILLCF